MTIILKNRRWLGRRLLAAALCAGGAMNLPRVGHAQSANAAAPAPNGFVAGDAQGAQDTASVGKSWRDAASTATAPAASSGAAPSLSDTAPPSSDTAPASSDTAPASSDPVPAEPAVSEQFVPSVARAAAGATLELRSESNVSGGEVKLKHLCRWSETDGSYFGPMADLTIARFQGESPFESVSLEELRATLRDAGVNIGVVRFAGATACTVTRVDRKVDQDRALAQWIDAREGRAPAAAPAANPAPATNQTTTTADTSKPAGAGDAAQAAALMRADRTGDRTLRDLLMNDAAVRLKLPLESLQINFNPADDKLLSLTEPQFKFNLDARRLWGLGDISWDVLIVTEAANKSATINASARAWQNQVVLVHPLAFRQVIRSEDVIEKRVLSDRLPDEPLLTAAQCVGQETARDLKPGTVMTSLLVNPAALAQVGQFITVTLASGNIHIKTVAKAMEAGSYGQNIRVKNEGTDEIYEVVLTGPQEGSVTPLRPAENGPTTAQAR